MTEKNYKEIADITVEYRNKAYKHGFMRGFVYGIIYSLLIIIIIILYL